MLDDPGDPDEVLDSELPLMSVRSNSKSRSIVLGYFARSSVGANCLKVLSVLVEA